MPGAKPTKVNGKKRTIEDFAKYIAPRAENFRDIKQADDDAFKPIK